MSIAIQSPHASMFVALILAGGFGLRWFARNRKQVGGWLLADRDFPLRVPLAAEATTPAPARPASEPKPTHHVLVATQGDTGLLRFAAEYAHSTSAELIVVFIRHVAVEAPPVGASNAQLDQDALRVQSTTEQVAAAQQVPYRFMYATGADIGQMVLDIAVREEVDTLVLGTSHRSRLWKVLKGDVVQTVADNLPKSIRLIVQA